MSGGCTPKTIIILKKGVTMIFRCIKLRLNTKGDSYLSTFLSISVILIFILFFVNLFGAFKTQLTLMEIGKNALRKAEIEGGLSNTIVNEIKSMLANSSIDVSKVTIDGTFDKTQLRSPVSITIKYNYPLKIINIDSKITQINLPLGVTYTGSSERFFR